MRRSLIVALAASALAACSSSTPAAGKTQEKGPRPVDAPPSLAPVEKKIDLPSGKRVLLRVAEQGGGIKARDRIARIAEVALPELEKACGFAYPRTWDVELRVHAARSECGGELGFYDFRERCIRVVGAIPGWLLVHELAHAWFGERFSTERWVEEGLAHHAALRVLRAHPELGDEAWVRASLVASWESAKDEPLSSWAPPYPLPATWSDADEARKNAFYAKAGLLFDLASARLGEDSLRKAARAIHEGGEARDGLGYLNALARADERAESLFGGWVAKRDYADASWSPEALRDRDGDGLSSAEELSLGTDPANADSDGDGRLDGDEVRFYRSDPRKKDTAPTSAVQALDERGDALEKIAPADLARFHVLSDGTMLTLTFETVGGFEDATVFWNVRVKTQRDDVIAGFGWKHEPWIGSVKDSPDLTGVEWRPLPRFRVAIEGKTARFTIPLVLIGDGKDGAQLSAYSAVKGGAARGDEVQTLDFTW